jgi:demethylmenaquinone methyltransferase/2-methoxy-6-polyprenyl-1,4-benzoquinol methylase
LPFCELDIKIKYRFGRLGIMLCCEPKERFVRDMFARIAPAYDLVNSLMSWGQDTRWRREAVRLACPSAGRVLDVATGTGNLALELAKRGGSVVGVDFCPQMIEQGRRKTSRRRLEAKVAFVLGDALALPFRDDSFDCVLNGFVLRNVVDVYRLLLELHRVVKPEGRVVCLELCRPPSRVVGALHRFYLHRVVPLLGWWLSGDKGAYRYLPESVEDFMSVDEFQRIMKGAGFRRVGFKSLNWGTVAAHVGVK